MNGSTYTRRGRVQFGEAREVFVEFYSDRIDVHGGFVSAQDEDRHKAWLKRQDAAGVPREQTVFFEKGDLDGVPRDGSV